MRRLCAYLGILITLAGAALAYYTWRVTGHEAQVLREQVSKSDVDDQWRPIKTKPGNTGNNREYVIRVGPNGIDPASVQQQMLQQDVERTMQSMNQSTMNAQLRNQRSERLESEKRRYEKLSFASVGQYLLSVVLILIGVSATVGAGFSGA